MGVLRTRIRRWSTVVALCAVALGLAAWRSAASTPAHVATRSESSALASCPRSVRRLGVVAFVARGRLELIDLPRCRVIARRAPGAGEVRFSPDGRWVAYGALADGGLAVGNPSGPVVIPAGGGAPRAPLGAGVLSWTWGPVGTVLYGITSDGSLVSATPDGSRRVVAANVVPIAYDYYGEPLTLSPDGARAAVDRSRCGSAMLGELDTVNVHSGAVTVAVRRPGDFFTFAGWSPDGRWLLFWVANMCSGSLAADGWPLDAVPAAGGKPVRVVPHMLLYGDYLSWCGSDLIAAAGPDRQTNQDSKLLSVAPPRWHPRTIEPAGALSWVSPSCAPGGRQLVAAAGPNSGVAGFGVEHRSVWLLRAASGARVRQLSAPPASYLSDEAPRFSRDGRWVMFVRSRVLAGPGSSDRSRDTIELVRASGAGGPIPVVSFTSQDFSYYDHFDWPYELDWSKPR
jgi:WD40-like Beta Propeller Repeat